MTAGPELLAELKTMFVEATIETLEAQGRMELASRRRTEAVRRLHGTGLSYRQIAELLDLTVAHVWQFVNRPRPGLDS